MRKKLLLFYVWTDIQILNSINVRANLLLDETADILIYDTGRISEKVYQVLNECNLFRNIFRINEPEFNSKVHKSVADYLVNVGKMKSYFHERLAEYLQSTIYEIMITSAFWSESLLVYKYLRRKSPEVKIQILEEGMADYTGTADWIFHTSPSRQVKARIRGLLYYGLWKQRARKSVEKCYLYEPAIASISQNIEAISLPKITVKNSGGYKAYLSLSDENHEIYKAASIIIVVNPSTKRSENAYSEIEEILEVLIHKNQKIVVKFHPMDKGNKSNLYEKYGHLVNFDTRKEPLEILLFSLDISEKVIIAEGSSVVLHMKSMFDKEPFAIMYYPAVKKNKALIQRYNAFISNFQKIYLNPSKIVTVRNFGEIEKTIIRYGGVNHERVYNTTCKCK